MASSGVLDLSAYGYSPIYLDGFYFDSGADYLDLDGDAMLSRASNGLWLLIGPSAVPFRGVVEHNLRLTVPQDVPIIDQMSGILEGRYGEMDSVDSLQTLFNKFPYYGLILTVKVSGGQIVEITLYYSP